MSFKYLLVLAFTGVATVACASVPHGPKMQETAAAPADCEAKFDQKAMSCGASSSPGQSEEAAIQAAMQRRMERSFERGGRAN